MLIENFGNKINSNGFDKNPENINTNGRPISIKGDLKRVLEANGQLTIKAENVSAIHDDGSVTVNLPQTESIVFRLLEWVNSTKGNESLKAIQMVMEQIDGKSLQNVDVNLGGSIINWHEEKTYENGK